MPAPPLISWCPTRAHSGIDAFSHSVVKSPKPMLEDYGRCDAALVQYFSMRRGCVRRHGTAIAGNCEQRKGAPSQWCPREERVLIVNVCARNNSSEGRRSGVCGSGMPVWRVTVVKESQEGQGAKHTSIEPCREGAPVFFTT